MKCYKNPESIEPAKSIVKQLLRVLNRIHVGLKIIMHFAKYEFLQSKLRSRFAILLNQNHKMYAIRQTNYLSIFI